MDCPHIPVFLNASGLYDVEFRIIAACRDGTLYTFKRFLFKKLKKFLKIND